MKEKERLTSGSSGCTPSEDAAQASLPDRQHDHKSDDDIYTGCFFTGPPPKS